MDRRFQLRWMTGALLSLFLTSAGTVDAAERPFLQRTLRSAAKAIEDVLEGLFRSAFQQRQAAMVAVPQNAGQNFDRHMNRLAAIEATYFQKVCNPTKEELKGFQIEATRRAKDLSKELAKKQNQNDIPDPRQQLAESLVKYVSEKLPAEKATRYKEEITERQEARKEAILGVMVNTLDRSVSLTEPQLAEVRQATLKKWNPRWSKNLSLFTYVDEYIPLPDQNSLNKILSKEQQVLLRVRQNYGEISFGWEVDLGFRDFTGVFNADGMNADGGFNVIINGDVEVEVEVEAEVAPDKK